MSCTRARWFGILIFLFSFGGGNATTPKLDPFTDWKTLKTPHFRIHTSEKLKPFSLALANHLEEAFEAYVAYFDWDPGTIEVRVARQFPLGSGTSRVFPFNRIEIEAYPLSAFGPGAQYHDWIRELAFHELAHVFLDDSSRGVASGFRAVFGSALKTTAYYPLWFGEGISTFLEARFAKGRSRIDGSIFSADFRAHALAKNHPQIDLFDEGPRESLKGIQPYLYGHWFVSKLNDKEQSKLIDDASRSLPFTISEVFEVAKGSDPDLVKFVTDELAKDSEVISQRVSKIGKLTRVENLSKSSGWTRAPVRYGDRIYFIEDRPASGDHLVELDLSSGNKRDLKRFRFTVGNQLAVTSDGNHILYSKEVRDEQFSRRSELFALSLGNSVESRLLPDVSAIDPAASEDLRIDGDEIESGSVVFVSNRDDANQALLSWKGEDDPVVLYEGKDFSRLSFPFLGRGKNKGLVSFSLKKNGATEQIVSLVGGTATALTEGSFGVWTENGDLVFVRDVGGYSNLYRCGAKCLKPKQVTQADTSLYYPVVTEKETLGVYQTSRGMTIARVEAVTVNSKIDQGSAKSKPKVAQGSSTEAEEVEYSILPALWPKYWLPYAQTVADGFVLGAFTSGTDSLDQHQYSLHFAWDTRGEFLDYRVAYNYEGLYPSIGFTLKQENAYLSGLKQNNRVEERSLKINYPMGDAYVEFGGLSRTSRLFTSQFDSGAMEVGVGYRLYQSIEGSYDEWSADSGLSLFFGAKGFVVGSEQFPALQAEVDFRFRGLADSHFVRLHTDVARTFNESVTANFYVGGSNRIVEKSNEFEVRGYAEGSLFGRSIATVNLEYHLPLWKIRRGVNAEPWFFRRLTGVLITDAGAAESLNLGSNTSAGFSTWLLGFGAQLRLEAKLLYHFPLAVSVGLHQGLYRDFGGETQVAVGLFSL